MLLHSGSRVGEGILSCPALTLLKGRSPYLSTSKNLPSLPRGKSITPKTSLKPGSLQPLRDVTYSLKETSPSFEKEQG